MKKISLKINGQTRTHEVDESMPLLYLLRGELALNGPKYGCGLEQCGSCMVLIDGRAGPSCRVPAAELEGKEIITLEGLAGEKGGLHPVQKAFVEEEAAQCGYCINGMVIAAVSLLRENPQPDETTIRERLERNLCRCGSHSRIVRAVRRAAGR